MKVGGGCCCCTIKYPSEALLVFVFLREIGIYSALFKTKKAF